MTGTPNQPPWRVLAALLLSAASFVYFIHLWKERAQLLPSEYIWTYLRISTIDPPMRSTVIYNGNHLALPTDYGTFTRKSEKATPAFREWLQANIYGHESVWVVLFWPLLASGSILLASLGVALVMEGETRQESRDGRLLRGARIVSHWRWNLPVLLHRKNRGFYIETK